MTDSVHNTPISPIVSQSGAQESAGTKSEGQIEGYTGSHHAIKPLSTDHAIPTIVDQLAAQDVPKPTSENHTATKTVNQSATETSAKASVVLNEHKTILADQGRFIASANGNDPDKAVLSAQAEKLLSSTVQVSTHPAQELQNLSLLTATGPNPALQIPANHLESLYSQIGKEGDKARSELKSKIEGGERVAYTLRTLKCADPARAYIAEFHADGTTYLRIGDPNQPFARGTNKACSLLLDVNKQQLIVKQDIVNTLKIPDPQNKGQFFTITHENKSAINSLNDYCLQNLATWMETRGTYVDKEGATIVPPNVSGLSAPLRYEAIYPEKPETEGGGPDTEQDPVGYHLHLVLQTDKMYLSLEPPEDGGGGICYITKPDEPVSEQLNRRQSLLNADLTKAETTIATSLKGVEGVAAAEKVSELSQVWNGVQMEKTFIYTPYFNSEDLGELAYQAVPSVPAMFSIMEQMLTGLKGFHDKGLVHQDIKEQNYLVNVESKPEASVKQNFRVGISDFGMVRPSDSTEISGTPAYLSPEKLSYVYEKRTASPADDVFAMGVTLYRLWNGFNGQIDLPWQVEVHQLVNSVLRGRNSDPPMGIEEQRNTIDQAISMMESSLSSQNYHLPINSVLQQKMDRLFDKMFAPEQPSPELGNQQARITINQALTELRQIMSETTPADIQELRQARIDFLAQFE